MSTLTAKELASMLNGREYGSRFTKFEDIALMNKLIFIYGASDDLMEFGGKIHTEVDCYGGVTVHLDKSGKVVHRSDYKDLDDYMPDYEIPDLTQTNTITAIWDSARNPCWKYETDIPHETFDIVDEGELYCRGIVFSMDDIIADPESSKMITLTDFQKLESLKQEIKDFLIMRCYELIEVKGWDKKVIEDYYTSYEITDTAIDVFFGESDMSTWIPLPLDLVFEPDFKDKLTERVAEERRLSELRRTEASRIREEAKREEKVKMLRELMKEFPEVAKEEYFVKGDNIIC